MTSVTSGSATAGARGPRCAANSGPRGSCIVTVISLPLQSLGQVHRGWPPTHGRVGGDRNPAVAFDGGGPCDHAAGNRGEVAAAADDRHAGRWDVENPDQARDAVAGHVIEARV